VQVGCIGCQRAGGVGVACPQVGQQRPQVAQPGRQQELWRNCVCGKCARLRQGRWSSQRQAGQLLGSVPAVLRAWQRALSAGSMASTWVPQLRGQGLLSAACIRK
jgi:hypothetical protein